MTNSLFQNCYCSTVKGKKLPGSPVLPDSKCILCHLKEELKKCQDFLQWPRLHNHSSWRKPRELQMELTVGRFSTCRYWFWCSSGAPCLCCISWLCCRHVQPHQHFGAPQDKILIQILDSSLPRFRTWRSQSNWARAYILIDNLSSWVSKCYMFVPVFDFVNAVMMNRDQSWSVMTNYAATICV